MLYPYLSVKMRTLMWITLMIFNKSVPAVAVEFSSVSFLSVNSGERVTLNCPFAPIQKSIFWYKQILGEMPRGLVKRLAYSDVDFYSEFKTSGFKIEMNDEDKMSLIIPHVKEEDTGLYYCGQSYMNDWKLSAGTFLSVTDKAIMEVSVLQRGVFSVPAGASVTLQCSVLSEGTTSQLQVLWFRAAPAQSHPQIIYTHHNSSQQCDSGSSTHTCVYNFSKNILSLNDTGTYYCAVLLCGKMLLGNGTRVQLETTSSEEAVVICVSVALAVCVVVIVVLICERRNYTHRARLTHHSVADRIFNQEFDNEELNYAALHFNERKAKRGRVKKAQPNDVIYSDVKSRSIT